MFKILLILFTVVPALEFYLLFKIGANIGAFNTFSIIIITGILGAHMAKREGLSVLHKLQQELSQNRMPAKQIIHGLMVFSGGCLLLTPGFITDILGFSMVLPGSRNIIASFLSLYIKNAIKNGSLNFGSMGKSGFHFYSSNQSESKDFFNQSNKINPNDTFEADFKKSDKED
jgi:UPF0716 protein FxsA